MKMSSQLYVTAFKDINRASWKIFQVQYEEYLMQFLKLVSSTDVTIVCFVDTRTMSALRNHCEKYDHCTLHPYNEMDTFFPMCYDRERNIMASPQYRKAVKTLHFTPEHNIPEYNIVNHNKVHFLKRAKAMFPHHDTYVWIDFHQARHNDIPISTNFDHLPRDKVTVCSTLHLYKTRKLTPEDIASFDVEHIHGSAYVVPRDMVDNLYHLYKEQLEIFYANNIADDDQSVHLAIHQRVSGFYNVIPARGWGRTVRLLSNDVGLANLLKNIQSSSSDCMTDHAKKFMQILKENWHHVTYLTHMQYECNDAMYSEIDFNSDLMIYSALQDIGSTGRVLAFHHLTSPLRLTQILSIMLSKPSNVTLFLVGDTESYFRDNFPGYNIITPYNPEKSEFFDAVITANNKIEVSTKILISPLGMCKNLEIINNKKIVSFGSLVFQGIERVRKNIKCELCDIMTQEKSYKGNGLHNYTILYHELFSGMRTSPVQLFEVGLGSCNVNIPLNKGSNGRPGASLYGWSKYFGHPDTICWGADIDKDIVIKHPKIRTFYVDHLDPSSLHAMWESPFLTDKMFDIIIDDGLHTPNANINMFMESIHKVAPGGVYIIENIINRNLEVFERFVDILKNNICIEYASIIHLPNANNTSDNTLIVIRMAKQSMVF